MNPVAASIALWRQKKISGANLLRAIVSHPAWNVPVTEAAATEIAANHEATRIQTSTSKDDKICVLLYSCSEAYKTYCDVMQIQGKQHFLTTEGTWVFRLPLQGVDEIHLDPLSPYDIFYTKDQFARLRDMADAIEIENTILKLRQGTAADGAVRRVRDYKNFYLPLAQHDGRPRILMAPDTKGRSLAAIFTADDTFDAFEPDARAQAGGQPVQQAQLDGEALFGILGRMQIDGLVFNCAGPAQPVAFAPGFAQVVLES